MSGNNGWSISRPNKFAEVEAIDKDPIPTEYKNEFALADFEVVAGYIQLAQEHGLVSEVVHAAFVQMKLHPDSTIGEALKHGSAQWIK